jgi:FAD/FMN-containing dehydrogenase
VVGFDVVTADGQWRHVDADHHPDLFWALRGGGAGLAVVTHFEYALHPLGPIVLGGILAWPVDQAKEVFTVLREEIANAPDPMAVEFIASTAPVADFVPPELQGKPVLSLVLTWMDEDHAEGERKLAPFREKVVPALNMIGPFPYTMLQSMLDVLSPHGRRVYNKIGYLKELTDDLIDVSLDIVDKFPNEYALFEITQLGGAVGRVAADDTAASAFREAGYFYIAGANWVDEAEDDACLEWVHAADAALNRFRLPGRYINFLTEDDEEDAREQLTDRTFARLAKVKAEYDPDNVFSRNPNIAVTAVR